MSEVVQSEYKGNPMLVIRQSSSDKFPFQFGVKKAKLMLEHVEAIRKFVQEQEKAASYREDRTVAA